MNKVLVKVFFPQIDKDYDIWIPLNRRIYDIISLLSKGVNELNDGIFQPKEIPTLYNRLTGEYYDLNIIVKNTNIRNGTELIMI